LPWHVDIALSNPQVNPVTGEVETQAMNLFEAAKSIGIDIDNIPLEELLYSGDHAEGSEEHYLHDLQVGWTNQTFEHWSARRAYTDWAGAEEGLWVAGSVPVDWAAVEAYETDMAHYDQLVESVDGDFDGGDDEPYEDPYGEAWTWEKQQEKWKKTGSTDESLFISQAHWESERAKAHAREFLAAQQQGQQASHEAYVEAVSQQGPAAVVSQPTPWTEKKIEAVAEHGLTEEQWKQSWDYQEEQREEAEKRGEGEEGGGYPHGLTEKQWKVSWDNPNRETE